MQDSESARKEGECYFRRLDGVRLQGEALGLQVFEIEAIRSLRTVKKTEADS